MSWWIYVQPEEEGPDPFEVNMTYNVGRMIRRAGVHPKVMDGMKPDQAVEVVGNAVAVMSANKGYFKQFEPDNGWGTVETTLNSLQELYHYLQKAPEHYVVRWR
jgi:hypothetical protein